MSGTPPGWYPDAQGTKRWFDGTSWTEHTQDATPTGPPSAPPSAPLAGPPSAPPAAPPQAAPETPQATPWGAPAYPSYDAQQPGYQQPTYQQPGYQQAPYGQAPYGEPTPTGPRRRTGLIAGLSALGVLLVVGAVIGAVLLVKGSDDTEKASSDTTTSADSRATASSVTLPPDSVTPDPVEPSTEVSSEPVDPDPAGSSDPEAVADGFMAAIFSGDCAAAESYVSDQLIETEGTCAGSEIPTGTFDGLTYEVGKADVSGDTATVPVTLVVDLGDDSGMGDIPGTDLTLSLTRKGSRWLVTDLA